jgi:muconolactone delta-isomerase
MRYLLKFTWKQPPTQEILALMPAEMQSGRELAEQGIAEAAYPSADQSVEGFTVWAVWNCESEDHLHELMKSQPMHDYFNHEVTLLADPFMPE